MNVYTGPLSTVLFSDPIAQVRTSCPSLIQVCVLVWPIVICATLHFIVEIYFALPIDKCKYSAYLCTINSVSEFYTSFNQTSGTRHRFIKPGNMASQRKLAQQAPKYVLASIVEGSETLYVSDYQPLRGFNLTNRIDLAMRYSVGFDNPIDKVGYWNALTKMSFEQITL